MFDSHHTNLKLDRLGPRSGVSQNSTDILQPSTAPRSSFSREHLNNEIRQNNKGSGGFFHNSDTGEYCGRTCASWMCIIGYGIVYLMFLTTYTLVILYVSLLVLQSITTFEPLEGKLLALTYSDIGLTATPTSESKYPLIWYKQREKDDYGKYVQAIDKLLLNRRRKRDLDHLGPCGLSPYGYGDSPCVILRINKNFHWSGKPLELNSTVTNLAPPEVINWIKTKKNRLWIRCSGYHPYDEEHIGSIKYYPDPPGIDPGLFPLRPNSTSPLIAIQISNFTIGISLAVECQLWHEGGPTSTEFVLYIAPTETQINTGLARANL